MDTGEMSQNIKSKFHWDSEIEYNALCLNNTVYEYEKLGTLSKKICVISEVAIRDKNPQRIVSEWVML